MWSERLLIWEAWVQVGLRPQENTAHCGAPPSPAWVRTHAHTHTPNCSRSCRGSSPPAFSLGLCPHCKPPRAVLSLCLCTLAHSGD